MQSIDALLPAVPAFAGMSAAPLALIAGWINTVVADAVGTPRLAVVDLTPSPAPTVTVDLAVFTVRDIPGRSSPSCRTSRNIPSRDWL